MMQIYFDDVVVGTRYCSSERLVTEEDLLSFADVSGDRHPIHVDAEFAARSRFGQRILHGPFGVAIATGMFGEFAEFGHASIAMTDISEWKFKVPIFIGDHIHLEMTIVSVRPSRTGHYGHVVRRMDLVNQHGDVVQSGLIGLLMAKSPIDEASTGQSLAR